VETASNRHGLLGFLRLTAFNLCTIRATRALGEPLIASLFDARHGIDTEGIREIGFLEVPSRSARHTLQHQAVDDVLMWSVRGIPQSAVG
jgi:hypothetical protein